MTSTTYDTSAQIHARVNALFLATVKRYLASRGFCELSNAKVVAHCVELLYERVLIEDPNLKVQDLKEALGILGNTCINMRMLANELFKESLENFSSLVD